MVRAEAQRKQGPRRVLARPAGPPDLQRGTNRSAIEGTGSAGFHNPQRPLLPPRLWASAPLRETLHASIMVRCWRHVGIRLIAPCESDRERRHWPASPLLLQAAMPDTTGAGCAELSSGKALARPSSASGQRDVRAFAPSGAARSAARTGSLRPASPGTLDCPLFFTGRAAHGRLLPLPTFATAYRHRSPAATAPRRSCDLVFVLEVRVAPDDFARSAQAHP